MEWIQALIAGLVLGLVFKKLKLPAPAPTVFAGVLGIVGVLLGSHLGQWLLGFFTQF
jgi:XapX domain-containing protein